MARKKITARFVDTVKSTGRRQEFCDTIMQGLGLRVSKEGTKSFFVRFRYRSKVKRITLGKYPALSLAAARQKALECMTSAIDGSLETHQELTVIEAYDLFIELYAKVKNKDWRVAQSRMKKFIKEYGGVQLTDLHRRDVISHLDKLMAAGTPIQANRVHSALSRFFNWCVERTYLEYSPCHGVKKPAKENPRDRVLNDDELLKIWNVCDQMLDPFGSLFKILILTAQRNGEVSGMRWSELDLKNRVWIIPKERSKNGRAHIVPLSQPVIDILEGIPCFLHSDLVFTTTGNTPVSGHGKYKKRIDEAAGVVDWVFHDFRRTAASKMPHLKVAPHVVEKILNHVSGTFGGIVTTYQLYDYDNDKREALDKWASFVEGLERNNLYLSVS